MNQSQIDRELDRIKHWYWLNWPLCIFCGHLVREKHGGQLAHLIRRSDNRALQTVKLNTGLAHFDCHSLYDDYMDQRIYLPRIVEVSYIIWLLDKDYFNRFSSNLSQLSEIFNKFPDVHSDIPDIEYHGEILTLQYLIS